MRKTNHSFPALITHGKRITLTFIAAALPAGLHLQAQEAEEEVFELSPFEVDGSNDSGYRANSTLTGSRLNTSLRDTAASVSVFTQQFLDDTGLTDLQEIAKYSVGSKNDLQDITSGSNINNWLGAAVPVRRVRIRGIRASKGIDYFQSFIPDDGYRADRYDESRGPNGILFGISEAGGIINTSLLRAGTQKDSGRVRYSFGSYERNRVEAKANKVLIENKLAVAVAGLYDDRGGFRDHEASTRDRYYGAITWKPSDRITVSANYEDGEHWGTRIRPFSASDKFLPLYLARQKFGADATTFYVGRNSDYGDETSAFEFDGRNPQETRGSESAVGQNNLELLGIDDITSRNNERYAYNATDGIVYNIGGLWESTSGVEDNKSASIADILAANTIEDIFAADSSGVDGSDPKILNYEQYGFAYPFNLNAGGPDMWRAEDFKTYAASMDFKLSEDLYLNLAHNYQEAEITAQFVGGSEPALQFDPNKLQRHPRNDDVDPLALNPRAGQLYFNSYWRAQEQNVESEETRAALSYELDFDDSLLGRHRFAAGWSKRETTQQFISTRWGFLGSPFRRPGNPSVGDFTNSNNRLAIRNYLTEGDFGTYQLSGPPSDVWLEDQTTITTDDGVERPVGWIRESNNSQNGRSDVEVDSLIFAMQNYFFDGRLATTFGYRKDEVNNIRYGAAIDPLYGRTLVTSGPDIEDAAGYGVDDPISANTKTAGVVYHLSEKFSLIGNYSTSIGLPEFRNIVFPNRGIADPVEGEGYDFGLGFSLFDGKVSGRAVYYDVESLNRTSSGGGTRIISDPMREAIRALNELRGIDTVSIVKADGSAYTDAEWDQEVDELNGASDGGTSPANRVNAFLQDEYTEGYELSLTANLSENWRMTFNASYTDRTLANYGREFARSAGWQIGEDGKYVNPITTDGDTALSVDASLLIEGSVHQRLLGIAERARGTYTPEEGDPIVLDGSTHGALLIGGPDPLGDLDTDDSIAYELWESLSGSNFLQDNIDEREKRWGLNPLKFNVFTAYDFEEGKMKGFTIGGGYRYLEGAIIGEDVDGNEFTNSSEGIVDLLLRYRQRLDNGNRIEYQVNVYNLLDKQLVNPVRYSILNDPTSPLSRFDLPTPREARATITYSF